MGCYRVGCTWGSGLPTCNFAFVKVMTRNLLVHKGSGGNGSLTRNRNSQRCRSQFC